MKTDKNKPTVAGGAKWSEFPSLLWRGIGMGIAEVIPGVSGGTIALITGVMQRFIEAIHSFDTRAIRLIFSLRIKDFFNQVHWRFLLMLFSGQFLGIILCTKILSLPKLFRNYPEPMLGLFFGLILGSSVLLARNGGKPGWRGILSYLSGAIIGLIVVIGIRAQTPDTPWFMLIVGAIVICAWILPGISGSFILLLLYKYDYVWEAVTLSNNAGVTSNFFNVILPFGSGALIGLALFSRTLLWVLKRWPSYTIMAMTGLLFSSLWGIFPFQHAIYETVASGKEKIVSTHPYFPSLETLITPSGLLTVLLLCAGFTLVLYINFLARKKNSPSPASVRSTDNGPLSENLRKETQPTD